MLLRNWLSNSLILYRVDVMGYQQSIYQISKWSNTFLHLNKYIKYVYYNTIFAFFGLILVYFNLKIKKNWFKALNNWLCGFETLLTCFCFDNIHMFCANLLHILTGHVLLFRQITLTNHAFWLAMCFCLDKLHWLIRGSTGHVL